MMNGGQDKKICDYFMRTGTCKFGSRCKFRHDRRRPAREDPSAMRGRWGSGQGPTGRSVGQGSDGKQRDPIKEMRYLVQHPLHQEQKMRQFVQAAWDACEQHRETEAMQILLDVDGIQRIQELCGSGLLNRLMSTKAGNQSYLISFQRVTIPFIRFLSCDNLFNCPLQSLYNKLLTNSRSYLDLRGCLEMIESMANEKSIQDPLFRDPPGLRPKVALWTPGNPIELVSPLVKLLSRIYFRYRLEEEAINTIEASIPILTKFLGVFEAVNARGHGEVCAELRKINIQVNFSKSNTEKMRILAEKEIQENNQRLQEARLFPENNGETSEPPGALHPCGPRHSNDHAQIADILIAPTPDEVLCKHAPFLPKNRAGDPSYPIPGATAAHRDLHFRLLRHDLIESIRVSVLRFQEAGGVKNLQRKQSVFRGRRDGRGSITNDVDVHIYRDVRIAAFAASKHAGVHYMIQFDDLPWLKNKSHKQREFWWKRSRRLQHGTLVCLWIEKNEPKLCFGVISDRNTEHLAQQDPMQRPMIGIRLATNKSQFNQEIIDACISGAMHNSREVVMLQAGASYFAYEPVLQALKNAPIPFEEYLTKFVDQHAPRIVDWAPRSPAYLLENERRSKFDFSCILSPRGPNVSEEQRAPLKTVDMANLDQFPIDLLLQESSLDMAQVQALKHTFAQELALIQGPPGTGKTYLGIQIVKLIITNCIRRQNGLSGSSIGPILCVCFTNHALDQFLGGLIDQKVVDVVRVGGRSKSERLDQFNLRHKTHRNTSWTDRSLLKDSESLLKKLEGRMETIGEQMSTISSRRYLHWDDVEEVLSLEMSHFEQSLAALSASPGFQRARSKRFNHSLWEQWIRQKPSDLGLQLYPESDQNVEHNLFAANPFALLTNIDGDERLTRPAANPSAEVGTSSSSGIVPSYAQGNQAGRENCEGPTDLNTLSVFDLHQISREDFQLLDKRQRTLYELMNCQEIWLMSSYERHKLHKYLRDCIMGTMLIELKSVMASYDQKRQEVREIEDKIGLEVLRKAQVVGMTTSGVAAHQKLVAALSPKVVIIEEAAEVLEAHILTSLSISTEHLILIGDHEQLRPKPFEYSLQVESGKGFNLDLSLFERLIRTLHYPHASLQTQRRMRPDFSRLIRSPIYPHLVDHELVGKYPNVPGMRKNLFFFDHNYPEQGSDDEGKSKSNDFEANFAVSLARYIMQQDTFEPGDVTIVTPYVGQLLKIKQVLSSTSMKVVLSEKDEQTLQEMEENNVPNMEAVAFGETSTNSNGFHAKSSESDPDNKSTAGALTNLKDCLRLATIDNFQGEESKIMILSLVRNNPKGKIGFLAMKNRINVLLSRAQHGMYILGNAESLRASSSKMWESVLLELAEMGSLGTELELVCQNHPEAVTMVSTLEDFSNVQDGGCSQNCQFRLECGHPCPRMCHPDDPKHVHTKCLAPCRRALEPCNHPCEMLCYQQCGPCKRNIDRVTLPCGHEKRNQMCFRAQKPETIMCLERIEVHIELCGHVHELVCHEKQQFLENDYCKVLLELKMPKCGHTIKVACGKKSEHLADPTLCSGLCGCVMSCGHICNSPCGGCIKRTLSFSSDPLASREDLMGRIQHLACQQKCGKNLFCLHACQTPCHGGTGPCPPCQQPCMMDCGHSKCVKQCGEPCLACSAECLWHCEHQGKCKLPCGAPCNRLPCDLRCTKKLECGCQCPCICGEECPSPDFCLHHGTPHVKSQEVDLLTMRLFEDLTEEDLNEDPLIVLGCGHVFTASTLDGVMELHKFYEKQDSRWVQPLALEPELSHPSQCPTCRWAIRKVNRYSRVVKKNFMDLSEVTFGANCARMLKNGEDSLKEAKTFTETLQNHGSTEDSARITDKARALANKACRLFGRVLDQFEKHPRMELYKRTKAAITEMGLLNDLSQEEVSRQINILGVPQPDKSNQCRAHIGIGASATIYLCSSGHILLKLLEMTGSQVKQKRDAIAQELQRAEDSYQKGLRHLQTGVQTAEQTDSLMTRAHGLMMLIQLHFQMVRHINQRFNDPIFLNGKSHQQLKHRQKSIVKDTKAAGNACLDVLALQARRWSHGHEHIRKQRQEIETLMQDAERICSGSLSGEDLDSLWAVLQGDDRISASTYGQGHIYRCPNGHIYIIGECGGAMQESTCPQCGSRIGGLAHNLVPGNTQVNDIAAAIRERIAG